MRKIRLMLIAMLLILFSGCYPFFIPMDDNGHRGHGEYEHGERGDRGYGERH